MSEFAEFPADLPVETRIAYADVGDVERLNKGRPPFPATSTRGESTIGDVEGFLSQIAGVLDGLLREKGYVTPVPTTAPTSVLVTLENFNALGAAYYVERAAKTRDKAQYEDAKSMWESAQKMLANGVVELDLPVDSEVRRPRGGFASTPTPFFTRDMTL